MGTNGFHAHNGMPRPGDDYLSLLDGHLRDELWSIGEVREHRAGDRIAEQGTPPDSVAVVLSGYVKTVRAARAGSREMLVTISGPGELLGAEAHWTNEPRHAGLVFSKDGEALVVGNEAFRKFLEVPAARNALVDTFAQRTVQREASLAFATHRVPIRLLAFLARMEAQYGKQTDAGVLLDLGLNCDDVGSAIGASTPAVTKALKDLKEGGVLTVQHKKVVLNTNLQVVLDRAREAESAVDEG
jgi:CRP-like cAMP-binding protein